MSLQAQPFPPKLTNITGLILAGGQGRRVDGADKGLLNYRGRPIVENQIHWFAQQVEQCLISANRNIERYQQYGLPVVTDESSGFIGPLGGIAAALASCASPWLFVLPVDVPRLPLNLLARLCPQVEAKAQACFLASAERKHYPIMLLRTETADELAKFLKSGNRRVRDFLKSLDARSYDLGINESAFANFNWRKDFEQ